MSHKQSRAPFLGFNIVGYYATLRDGRVGRIISFNVRSKNISHSHAVICVASLHPSWIVMGQYDRRSGHHNVDSKLDIISVSSRPLDSVPDIPAHLSTWRHLPISLIN